MSNTTTKNIGELVKTLRSRKGITQGELARKMRTSQSAIARIEKGEQNLSTSQIAKIEKVLESKIMDISNADEDFEIIGGHKLSGTAVTNYSKNGSVALLFASLLNKRPTLLHGIARIEEVNRVMEILESIGVKLDWQGEHSLLVSPPKEFLMDNLAHPSVGKIRSSLMAIGPLIHKYPKFRLPHAGGCKMGERTISAHRYALESMGVNIVTQDDFYEISAKKISSADITMYESSDTATINALLAAALVPKETTIRFATPNYQVQEICFFLEKFGVKIEGIGTHVLKITGVEEISADVEYHNSEDPIESMMFLSAGVTTHSHLIIERCPIDFLRLELVKLEKMGLKFNISKTYLAGNGRTELADIEIKPSKLHALPDKIHAQPYPGINTDNLPFFVPIATQAEGTTKILDWMWENRAIYFTELNRLGANVILADPHRVFIEGPTKMRGSQIVCPPALRPSVIILIAMLAAEGRSVLRGVYSINRGYEDIVGRLNAIGAEIRPFNS